MTIIAFIPARSGSTRIPNKNIKEFFGHPLIAYTIYAAHQANIFEKVIVSSDSMDYERIARRYNAGFIHRRFPCDNLSPDKEWITSALAHMEKYYQRYDAYAILRPTNPFRQPETIIRGWEEFKSYERIDSIRAVAKCRKHPYKMWVLKPYEDNKEYMTPLIDDSHASHAYNSPYQALPIIYEQVGALDICRWNNLEKHDNELGSIIRPFHIDKFEAFDINDEIDWVTAETIVRQKLVNLVKVGWLFKPVK